MSEDRNRPRFRWIFAGDTRDCSVRYCVKQATYWAIWDPDIRRAICGVHRGAVENKSWQEVSEIFRSTRPPE